MIVGRTRENNSPNRETIAGSEEVRDPMDTLYSGVYFTSVRIWRFSASVVREDGEQEERGGAVTAEEEYEAAGGALPRPEQQDYQKDIRVIPSILSDVFDGLLVCMRVDLIIGIRYHFFYRFMESGGENLPFVDKREIVRCFNYLYDMASTAETRNKANQYLLDLEKNTLDLLPVLLQIFE
ncbi:unnamed protein product [Sphagnum balticum]